MSKNKLTILWCWWYDRQDLIAPLLPVMEQADNHFLFYRFAEQEQLSFALPGTRHFWTDYTSPYQLISQVKPDRVVFMGIENMLTIALLSACRKVKVTTCYLAHGVTTNYKAAVRGEETADLDKIDARYSTSQGAYQKKKYHSLFFYLYAMARAGLNEKFFLLRFLTGSFKYASIHERLYRNQSVYRQADEYLVFTRHLSALLIQRDGVEDSRIREIGIYMLDGLFKELSPANSDSATGEKYLLMIDQPLGTIDEATQAQFWYNLATASQQLGYKLIVKLHPSNYSKPDPANYENCTWVRQEESNSNLVKGATACLGYFSTLLLPVIWYKPVGLFNPTQQPLAEEWLQLKVAGPLPYPGVTADDLVKIIQRNPGGDFMTFEKNYLFKADGQASQRLAIELLSNTAS